jgi:hypothetical protein
MLARAPEMEKAEGLYTRISASIFLAIALLKVFPLTSGRE